MDKPTMSELAACLEQMAERFELLVCRARVCCGRDCALLNLPQDKELLAKARGLITEHKEIHGRYRRVNGGSEEGYTFNAAEYAHEMDLLKADYETRIKALENDKSCLQDQIELQARQKEDRQPQHNGSSSSLLNNVLDGTR